MSLDPRSFARVALPRIHRVAAALGPLFLVVLNMAPVQVFAAPDVQSGAPGEMLFQTECAACHTIGKGERFSRRAGPAAGRLTLRRT